MTGGATEVVDADDAGIDADVDAVGATGTNAGTVPVTVWSAIVVAVVEAPVVALPVVALPGTVSGAAVSAGDAGAGGTVEVASTTGAAAATVATSGAGSGAGSTARKAATGKGMPRTPTTANADIRRCDGLTLCLRSYAPVHSAQLY
ncbi:MAG TPA: hypothetical protein VIT64_11985 [Ilumatobacteraceae bacterium]